MYKGGIPPTENDIRKSSVKAEGKEPFLSLHQAFLPLPKLRDLVTKYRIPNLNSISISPQPHDDELDWRFLDRLQVKFTDGIYFYLHAISQFSDGNQSIAVYEREAEDTIHQLYQHIQQRCNENLELV